MPGWCRAPMAASMARRHMAEPTAMAPCSGSRPMARSPPWLRLIPRMAPTRQAGLVQGTDGNFYGTTYSGGANGDGTVFRMTTNGALDHFGIVQLFCKWRLSCRRVGTGHGRQFLWHGLIRRNQRQHGTLFRMTTNGTLTALVSFNSTNGSYPYGGLVQGADGNFYGTTEAGGANGYGTVFSITTNGTLTTLVSFINYTNGPLPMAGWCRAPTATFMARHTAGARTAVMAMERYSR